MRIDNSSRGNAIFVEQLAEQNPMDANADGIINDEDRQLALKKRIELIKKDGLSLKPLTQALQQRAQQNQPQISISQRMLETNQRGGRETMVKGIKK